MSNIKEFNWYEIFPYQQEYKDEYELINNRYNFAFVLSKETNNIRTFMQSKDISTSNFQVKDAKLEDIKLFQNNYELYLSTVFPISTEVIRDKLYEVFANPRVSNTTLIVSARKISYYYPLTVKNSRYSQKGVLAKTEGKKGILLGNNKEVLYQCKIVVSANHIQNMMRIKEALPQDHNTFYSREISAKKVSFILNRKRFYTSIIGYFFNILGWNMVRDTVINKTGLANLVQLPLLPSRYTITPGQSSNISQGFLEESD